MCCCCSSDGVHDAPEHVLKRELRRRFDERVDDWAYEFFRELRRDLREGRVDDALLLLDRMEFPKHRGVAEAMVAFA